MKMTKMTAYLSACDSVKTAGVYQIGKKGIGKRREFLSFIVQCYKLVFGRYLFLA